MKFLDKIRCNTVQISTKKKYLNTFLMLIFGVTLGVFSKFLDDTPSNTLPYLFEYLDLRNFFSRLSIWILLAVCISIYSYSSKRAALNVFVFFLGMVTSYYLYSNYISGFFPRNYALIWFGITLVSPILAFICWYAKGEGPVSVIISAVILAVLFNCAFNYGWIYFDISYFLELVVLIVGLIVLRRNTIKESAAMTAIVIAVAVVLNTFIPFGF